MEINFVQANCVAAVKTVMTVGTHIPQGLKPDILRLLSGTTEVVP